MKKSSKYFFLKVIIIFCLVFALASCGDKNSGDNSVSGGEDLKIEKSENKVLAIESKVSPIDFNNNGNDDYKDFLIGAQKDAANKPVYDSAYVDGGYPEDSVGVCTDVIWRAFKEAGYSLKDMIDKDITRYPDDYTSIKKADSNIDFRRVKNQHVFFEKYAVSLTTDINDISEWSAGDIVIFKDDYHIGMISDKRNKNGVSYVIHNMGQSERDEDFMKEFDFTGKHTPIAHYRFDASQVPSDVLVEWK